MISNVSQLNQNKNYSYNQSNTKNSTDKKYLNQNSQTDSFVKTSNNASLNFTGHNPLKFINIINMHGAEFGRKFLRFAEEAGGDVSETFRRLVGHNKMPVAEKPVIAAVKPETYSQIMGNPNHPLHSALIELKEKGIKLDASHINNQLPVAYDEHFTNTVKSHFDSQIAEKQFHHTINDGQAADLHDLARTHHEGFSERVSFKGRADDLADTDLDHVDIADVDIDHIDVKHLDLDDLDLEIPELELPHFDFDIHDVLDVDFADFTDFIEHLLESLSDFF